MSYIFGLVVVILIIILTILLTNSDKEPLVQDSWAYLYENYNRTRDIGTWEWDSTKSRYVKQDIKIQLKSYDIGVSKGNVQMWALYSDDQVASSMATGVSGFGNAYTDTYYAATPKYKKIVDVKSGERVVGTIDFPVKRIIFYANTA
jgi:hypothetical protein